MTHTHKVCGCCKDCKPVTQFWRMTAASDGLQDYCKPCMNAKKNEWRKRGRFASRQKWAAIAQAAARL